MSNNLPELVTEYFSLLDKALASDEPRSAWVASPAGTPRQRITAWRKVHDLRRHITEVINEQKEEKAT